MWQFPILSIFCGLLSEVLISEMMPFSPDEGFLEITILV